MKFKNLFNHLKRGAKIDTRSPEKLALKTTEELGEVVEALNWYLGDKATNKSKKEIQYALAEEISDVIICQIALAHKLGLDPDYLDEVFEKKHEKWISKFKKK